MSFQHFSFYCRNFMLIAFASAVVITMAGCGQQQLPFEAKSSEKPKPIHCFDAVRLLNLEEVHFQRLL